jgi:hypothetical protein
MRSSLLLIVLNIFTWRGGVMAMLVKTENGISACISLFPTSNLYDIDI